MRFTIMTWNLRRRPQGYAYLDEHLRPDVALLQETSPPPGRGQTIYRAIGGARNWGSAITSRRWPLTQITSTRGPASKQPADLLITHPGCTAIARITPPDHEPIVLVSIYGLIDNGYAHTTMHRLLSDLTPLLDSHRNKRLILGGDLNLSTQLKETDARHHRPAFDRLAAFGLIDLLASSRHERQPLADCPCRDNPCTHVQTYRHSRGNTPWQNDYLYATKTLADELVDCRTISGGRPDPWDG